MCAKHLPNMARYPQQHLEILKILMAVVAVDTIGHLAITSKGNRWAVTAIYLHMSYVFAVPMKEKSDENVVQAYFSGLLTNKDGSVAILSGNSTEFKNKVLNEVCDQLGINNLFANSFHPQGNAKVENIQISLKGPSPSSWKMGVLRGMNSFHFLAIVIIYFQVAM